MKWIFIMAVLIVGCKKDDENKPDPGCYHFRITTDYTYLPPHDTVFPPMTTVNDSDKCGLSETMAQLQCEVYDTIFQISDNGVTVEGVRTCEYWKN